MFIRNCKFWKDKENYGSCYKRKIRILKKLYAQIEINKLENIDHYQTATI